MPNFTITLTDAQVRAIKFATDRYNSAKLAEDKTHVSILPKDYFLQVVIPPVIDSYEQQRREVELSKPDVKSAIQNIADLTDTDPDKVAFTDLVRRHK